MACQKNHFLISDKNLDKISKAILLFISLMNFSCAQSPFIERYFLYKRYVIIDNQKSCDFIAKISTKSPPNSKKVKDAPLWAILDLKEYANYKLKSGNALYNIHMTEQDFPVAKADVYQCPQEIFDKYKALQQDEDYRNKNIKFDLVLENEKELK